MSEMTTRNKKDVFPRPTASEMKPEKGHQTKQARQAKNGANMDMKRPGRKQEFDTKKKPIQSRRCANPKPMIENYGGRKQRDFHSNAIPSRPVREGRDDFGLYQ